MMATTHVVKVLVCRDPVFVGVNRIMFESPLVESISGSLCSSAPYNRLAALQVRTLGRLYLG